MLSSRRILLIFFVPLYFLISPAGFAQHNPVRAAYPGDLKVHLFSLIYENYDVEIDRLISKKTALTAGAIFVLGNVNLSFDTTEILKKKGIGGFIGVRNYLMTAQMGPDSRGAYLESRLRAISTSFSVYNGTDSITATANKLYLQFNVYLGVEVVIGRRAVLDVFAGPGIGNGSLCFSDGNCERETEMFQGIFGLTGSESGKDKPLGIGMDGGLAIGIVF